MKTNYLSEGFFCWALDTESLPNTALSKQYAPHVAVIDTILLQLMTKLRRVLQ